MVHLRSQHEMLKVQDWQVKPTSTAQKVRDGTFGEPFVTFHQCIPPLKSLPFSVVCGDQRTSANTGGFHLDHACFEVKSLVAGRLIVIEDCFLKIYLLVLVLNYCFSTKTKPMIFDQTLLKTQPVLFTKALKSFFPSRTLSEIRTLSSKSLPY